ncbi:alpha/beta fold hydrolase [Antrihabitans cavernicola]|uniref:Alpha/beta fold hydrolase n=1 Tax=Antrihabitans cavernicola TaxID=2495913 RepID=A0A5A7SDG4_9NOCA|nr:alpha/beta hydrolase [Spelaeibacter cavernicola]KAA0023419.1 alpha/beta fold hydrolase [Spelaeibacter cavernicola]
MKLTAVAPVGEIRTGTMVDLPGRGSTYVVDSGPSDGPTLLLLHSVACTGMLTWYPVFDRLAAKGRVVVFDQRWHGRGIRSPRFTLEDCVDDGIALADVLGIDRFVAVGYSMGSLLAQLTWRMHADRVAGLVLCAATTSFRRAPRERMVLDGFARAVATIGADAGPLPVDGGRQGVGDRRWAYEQFRQTTSGAVSGAVAAIGKFDSADWVADIDVPTSVVVTARDRAIPPSRQRWLARQIAGATSYEVNCGHAGCVMNAEEFSSGLLPACSSVLARVRL